MLRLDALPARTGAVFKRVSTCPLMDGFVLIGGTALSLQIAHRQSEDLDFWLPMSQMSSDRVNAIMENLKTFGCSVQLMTPA